MARIYFDSNVFSNLRRAEQTRFIALKNAIEKHRDNFVFIFSHAHIRDKINDNSEFKFKDFDFMETWVHDNYLSYHATEQKTSFYLATPLQVFNDSDSLENINYIMEMVGSYKELRSVIESGIGKIPLGNEIYNLDDLFKDGQVQKQFVSFVKSSLYHKDKERIPYYDFYLHSYVLLDMLGFNKDKLNRKNTFNNIFNDSLHSYYARYCDYLITEDGGLKEKSSILYSHYGVVTQILSVDEFVENIDSIVNGNGSTLIEFFEGLGNDLANAPLISTQSDQESTTFLLSPSKKYLNFFDLLQVLRLEDGIYVFLINGQNHYLSGAIYRETQLIVNRMLKLFGDDMFMVKAFDFEKEVEELRSNSWKGRYWEIGDTPINLHVNKSSNELCVQIGPFTRWIYTSRFRDEKIVE